jgi:16S rRNA U1498 N3-methylase RsmE
MTRFFVTPEEMQASFLVLTGENAQHAKVLRLKMGKKFWFAMGKDRSAFAPSVMLAPDRSAWW